MRAFDRWDCDIIETCARDAKTHAEVMDSVRLEITQTRKHLNSLVENAMLERTGEGRPHAPFRFSTTEVGREALTKVRAGSRVQLLERASPREERQRVGRISPRADIRRELDDGELRRIRDALIDGVTQREVARRFRLSVQVIVEIAAAMEVAS